MPRLRLGEMGLMRRQDFGKVSLVLGEVGFMVSGQGRKVRRVCRLVGFLSSLEFGETRVMRGDLGLVSIRGERRQRQRREGTGQKQGRDARPTLR